VKLQRTLCIIKPDASEKRAQGEIFQSILDHGFRVVALRQLRLTRAQAEGFYDVHRGRPFFDELCTFMSRGPVIVMALECENAVGRFRELIGATNPEQAGEGTLRKQFGTNVGENAVHGSDSEVTAQAECAYFFAGLELL
jgi:nucleoside-diphosphate kinase